MFPSPTSLQGVPKMTDDLKNQFKKMEGNRNVRFAAFCFVNQGNSSY